MQKRVRKPDRGDVAQASRRTFSIPATASLNLLTSVWQFNGESLLDLYKRAISLLRPATWLQLGTPPEAFCERLTPSLHGLPWLAVELLLALLPQSQRPFLELLEVLEQADRVTRACVPAALFAVQVLLLERAFDLLPDLSLLFTQPLEFRGDARLDVLVEGLLARRGHAVARPASRLWQVGSLQVVDQAFRELCEAII